MVFIFTYLTLSAYSIQRQPAAMGHLTRLFFLLLFTFTSVCVGFLSNEKSICDDTLFNVVGNHYNPRKLCSEFDEFMSRELYMRQKYLNYFISKQKPVLFKSTVDVLDDFMKLLPLKRNLYSLNNIKCIACSAGVNLHKILHKNKVEREELLQTGNRICKDFLYATRSICDGIIKLYGESVLEILENTNSTSDEICSTFLNLKCGRGASEVSWNVTLPNIPKPPLNETLEVPEEVTFLKVLHISDTHWDRYYQVGSWSECTNPLCCRKENVRPNLKEPTAGKYGGYKCDIPEETFDSMLEHIKKQHPDISYVVWTGDIPAHDIWNQTREENLEVLKKTVNKLIAAFPNISIYPALGNHESVPGNLFPVSSGKENSMGWLYKALSDTWKTWVPEEDMERVESGAFYTTLIEKDLRLVSLNMNYCYKFNWWLVNEKSDPLQELHWLANVLQQAEDNGEKVHIIGHIPPGSTDCLRTWQSNYYNIIQRYEATVDAQFFGHTHADEFQLMYDRVTNRPYAVAYTAPSLTTYTYHNPSYRIYYVQSTENVTSKAVMEHETWYFDLLKANEKKFADWQMLYKASEAYKMKGLTPKDWHQVFMGIKTSEKMLQLYHKHYWNDSKKRPLCGNRCRERYLCSIRSCVLYNS